MALLMTQVLKAPANNIPAAESAAPSEDTTAKPKDFRARSVAPVSKPGDFEMARF
jgi:hypothetical protein